MHKKLLRALRLFKIVTSSFLYLEKITSGAPGICISEINDAIPSES
jgi:hypothetical protein